MTIQLPENLESHILAAVHNGRYASLDAAMAEAAALLVQRLEQEQATTEQPATGAEMPDKPYKPIWEVADDIRKGIPAEEWAKLPADGARQIDHYIYGSPKRPSA